MSAGGLLNLTSREAEIFACLTDVVVAPAGALPPVSSTDAVRSFDASLAAAPRINRIGLRVMLHAIDLAPRLLRHGGRLRELDPAARTRAVAALDHHPLAVPMLKALRGIAHLSYYGDEHVMGQLGYEPARIVEQAALLRAREGRW
jgi:hypothetical protein